MAHRPVSGKHSRASCNDARPVATIGALTAVCGTFEEAWRQTIMRRIFFRFAVGLAAFTLGVSVSTLYRLYTLPELIMVDTVSVPSPAPCSCFPGLSVVNEKGSVSSAYFQSVALSTSAWSNQFRIDWYSQHLRAMDEMPLASWPAQGSYRFLWLR